MDSYYKMIVVHDLSLYNKLKLKVYDSNQIYTLILTGDPLKYVYTVYETGNLVSIRKFYNQMTNKSHDLIYYGCKFEMNTCNKCRDSVIKPVLKMQCAYSHLCLIHTKDIAIQANDYACQFGKLYFENLFHHYYLFSHYEIINDIKCHVRDLLF